MNKFQTRQAQLPPSLRSLTLSTKLERMKAYGTRGSPLSGSPLSASPGYSAFSMSSPESPRTPSTASDEVSGFSSLPPPPRRTRPRRVPAPEYVLEENASEAPKLSIKTFRRQSAMSLDEATVAESPTMAWLQREEQSDSSNRGSRGSIFGQVAQPVTIAEEEEPRTEVEATTTAAGDERGEKRVSAAIAAAKAALEAAAAVDTDASGSKLDVTASNANPNPEQLRPESSLEGIHVAQIQYLTTSKPRIISAGSPTTEETHSPTRLPVDDRDSPPPSPVQSENPATTVSDGIAPDPVHPATGTALPQHHHTWSPGHHANLSSATLPLRIAKRPRNMSERSTVSLPPPKSPSSAPSGHKFLVPKGSTSKGTLKHRTRSKLVKAKSTTTVDMEQLRAFIASRDGSGRALAASAVPSEPSRSRPLISSHTKSASRSSGCSMDSSTTYNPPSTIDIRDGPRISISSTIYTSSNDHAAVSVPNTATHPPLSPGIESFIGSSSEEGEFNPYAYQRHDILHEIQSEQVIDSDNYQLMSILSGTNMNTLGVRRSRSPKPPVPRTPKPIFSRKPFSASSSPSSPMHSPTSSLVFEGYQSADGWDPASGNWLAQEERADLIKKSRKLARVFGTTPGADIMAYQESRSVSQSRASKNRHLRTPLSISNDQDNTVSLRQRRASAWPSPTESHFSNSSSSRRHSAPLSPDDISFLNVSSPLYEASFAQVASQFRPSSSAAATTSGSQVDKPSNDRASVTDQERSANAKAHTRASSPSRTSFIDWSDEEGLDDGLSIISQEPPSKVRRPTSPTHSFYENLTPEEQAEEEKRRKREKLAKLHRFLGSRVPVNLVVGLDFENDMPSQSPRPTTTYSTGSGSGGGNTSLEFDESGRKAWMRRRRSSSAAALPSWSDDRDRIREELDTKEKLLNVRRAQKMEKVFGVAPPQTLYHTRGHTPSPSMPSLAPVAAKTMGNPSAFIPSSDAMYFTRNPNRSSYDKSSGAKLSRRRTGRPSTAESTKHLIPKGRRSSSTTSFNLGSSPPHDIRFSGNHHAPRGSVSQEQSRPGAWTSSAIYNHYQHSLNSLNDIIDRDDRESLVELHNYLNQDQEPEEPPHRVRERRLSDSSILTERRRSFPPESASIISFGSEAAAPLESATTPTKGSDLTDFQQRRRRAAKLTQFFGVQYRELINDVLDSLENGLEHEQKRGTLQADEIADLLDRLRELKVKREGIKA